MVCLYMHLKVGRGGETCDQRNKEQGSCLTNSGSERDWSGFARRSATPDCLSALRLELQVGVYTNHSARGRCDKDENLISQSKLMTSQSEGVLSQFCLLELLNHITTNYCYTLV